MGGGGGIGIDPEPAPMRCPYAAPGAQPLCSRNTKTTAGSVSKRRGARIAGRLAPLPGSVKSTEENDDGVSDVMVTAAVDELMSSDTSSVDTPVVDTSVDTSTDISSPDTESDFGGFDGGDSGGGGASGDF